jgi:hypothetical protein
MQQGEFPAPLSPLTVQSGLDSLEMGSEAYPNV